MTHCSLVWCSPGDITFDGRCCTCVTVSSPAGQPLIHSFCLRITISCALCVRCTGIGCPASTTQNLPHGYKNRSGAHQSNQNPHTAMCSALTAPQPAEHRLPSQLQVHLRLPKHQAVAACRCFSFSWAAFSLASRMMPSMQSALESFTSPGFSSTFCSQAQHVNAWCIWTCCQSTRLKDRQWVSSHRKKSFQLAVARPCPRLRLSLTTSTQSCQLSNPKHEVCSSASDQLGSAGSIKLQVRYWLTVLDRSRCFHTSDNLNSHTRPKF